MLFFGTSYPLLNVFLWMLWFFLFIIWIWLLISIFADIFRSEMSGWAKAGWTIFVILLPFGVMFEFDKIGTALSEAYPIIGPNFVWLSVPFSVLVMWVFHTMERIGRVSENPFEGTPNDVPITPISRGIEIDMREMLDETPSSIPAPIEPQYDTQL